jgi:hypothetical protein
MTASAYTIVTRRCPRCGFDWTLSRADIVAGGHTRLCRQCRNYRRMDRKDEPMLLNRWSAPASGYPGDGRAAVDDLPETNAPAAPDSARVRCPLCGSYHRPDELERVETWEGETIERCPKCQQNVADVEGAAAIRELLDWLKAGIDEQNGGTR